MKNDAFNIYDPFVRQRKKRTGSASNFGILYQQGIDKPAIAKIVEAARRTERGRDGFDEVRVEERAEWIDDQARADASNATYGDNPFAPRDFAAKHRINLTELGRKKNKRHPLQWALHGTEERQYQQANDAFGQRDYEELMAIPERRKIPRESDSGIGQPGDEIIVGDLGPSGPVRELPGRWIKRPFPMPTIEPREDGIRRFQPIPISDPPTDGGEKSPEGGNDVAPLPGRIRFPYQPVEDHGMEPIPGGPPYEHPKFGRGYPFPQPVTEPRQAAEEEPLEINPGFGQAERALLIDQLIGAIATGQISIGAVKELVGTDQMNKLAVQGMNAFANAEEEAFPGDGLNQFTAINTDPRAGPSALRPDSPKPDSPLQPDEASEEADSRIDLYKTAAGQRNTPPHHSESGTIWNDEPDEKPRETNNEPTTDKLGVFPRGVTVTLNSRWGWRTKPDGEVDFHPGIDYGVPSGTEVLSAQEGKIATIFKDGEYYGVIVEGKDSKFYTYYHINPADLVKGHVVKKGTRLGSTSGSHLHYSCHEPDEPKNSTKEKGEGRDDSNSCDPLP